MFFIVLLRAIASVSIFILISNSLAPLFSRVHRIKLSFSFKLLLATLLLIAIVFPSPRYYLLSYSSYFYVVYSAFALPIFFTISLYLIGVYKNRKVEFLVYFPAFLWIFVWLFSSGFPLFILHICLAVFLGGVYRVVRSFRVKNSLKVRKVSLAIAAVFLLLSVHSLVAKTNSIIFG